LKRELLILLVAFGLLLALAVSSLAVGAVPIPMADVVDWMLNKQDSGLSVAQRTILWDLRLPRIFIACFVGGSLAAAGVGFQGLFRNVLADPYVIGASSGAALGATLVVVAGVKLSLGGLGATVIGPMLGSIAVVLVVFVVGSLGRHASALTLLLAGIAISSMTNAIVSLLMFLNDQKAIVILSWLMGSLAGSDWSVVWVSSVAAPLGFILLWGLARQMDAFLLGDAASQSLGLSLMQFRMLMIVGASLLTASAVGSAGIIGFVGLISPQIARLLIGAKHCWLIPMSSCVGAIILIVGDAIARTVVAPAELPVGIVTAMLGCPFFLSLLLSSKTAGRM
jgi:iron complex transport system permease protein